MKKGQPKLTLSNRQNHKPVSVLICHLSSQPTPRNGTGRPIILTDVPVYMVLLVLVPSPPDVAIRRRELLPRGFTLALSGGLFSVTAFIRLLPSALSAAGCPCQSGLSSATARALTSVGRDRNVLPIIMFSKVQLPPFRGKMFYPIPKSLPFRLPSAVRGKTSAGRFYFFAPDPLEGTLSLFELRKLFPTSLQSLSLHHSSLSPCHSGLDPESCD